MGENKAATHIHSLDQFFLWRLLKRIRQVIRLFFYTLLIGALASIVLLLYLKSRPLPSPEVYTISTLYDDQGNYLGQLDQNEPRDPIRLNEVPKSLIKATLAAEDKNFYSHHGFSLGGIARATLANIKAGHVVQGASTITQQLARNLYLTHDRTWTRKLKEAILTAQLELHFSKDEILEMYLNEIYYGHGAYGIGQAAKFYFNKKVQDLNLAECALLAGIPRGPYFYSPYQHLSRAISREHHILDLMVKNHMITAEAAREAKKQTLTFAPKTHPKQMKAQYFRDYIVHTLVTRYGLDEAMVRHGGLKIYTTLNAQMQQAAEQSVNRYTKKLDGLQSALISVDPHTGQIKALVGGKDYASSQFNRIFARRQPGSAFKPILYLSALENGFTPITRIMSKPTGFLFNGKEYRPSNFRGHYANRPITLREAIARSDNIYAVSTLMQIGLHKEIEMARRLGIRSLLQPTPSLALGSYAVTPFELAESYATIASGGVRHPLTGIKKVLDPFGRVLVQGESKPVRVASSAHTFVLTKLMESVFSPGGTGGRVHQLFSRPAAGKTGTTDWDGWLSGFTPDLVTTVWVGYDHSKQLPHDQARLSQYIWADYMNKATRLQPSKIFPIPRGVTGVYVDLDTGYMATPECKHTRLEYFIKGTEPTETCPVHRKENGSSPKEPSLFKRVLDWLKSF
jgi:1A family penicillin-binding protein